MQLYWYDIESPVKVIYHSVDGQQLITDDSAHASQTSSSSRDRHFVHIAAALCSTDVRRSVTELM